MYLAASNTSSSPESLLLGKDFMYLSASEILEMDMACSNSEVEGYMEVAWKLWLYKGKKKRRDL